MKRVLTGLIALVFFTSSAFAQNSTIEGLQAQLADQRQELAVAKEQLKKAKLARAGWVTLTVATGAIALLTALPGVVSTVGGIKNVAQGQQWLGDPDSGGAIMIPVIIVATAISAGTGYATYKGYQKIELRTTDIEALLEKISKKEADIAQAAELLKIQQ